MSTGIGYGLVRGKDVGEERLRIEAAAERVRNELMVEFKQIGTKLTASAGKGVKVVEIEVGSDRDSYAGRSQHIWKAG